MTTKQDSLTSISGNPKPTISSCTKLAFYQPILLCFVFEKSVCVLLIRMNHIGFLVCFYLSLFSLAFAAMPAAPLTTPVPCTVANALTGNFYDLRPLIRQDDYWRIRGFDYGHNFTMSICSAVENAEGASDKTAAFYYDDSGRLVSLGKPSSDVYFRGKNLVLEYKNGSRCMGPSGEPTPFRKSATLVFKCDRNVHAIQREAYISYIASQNDCSFFFNVYTPYACPQVDKNTTMSPVALFLIIGVVAALVYFFGSLFYKPALMFNGIANLARKKSHHFTKRPFDLPLAEKHHNSLG